MTDHMKKKFSLVRAAAIGSICGLFLGAVGCANDWHSASPKYLVPYQNGDFATAAAESLHCAHDSVPTDAVLFNLDAGALQRTIGNIGESTARFDDADALVGNYEQWPDVAIGEEFGAALTSARSINYRGKFSDLVMLNTYRALDHMELGQNNGARSMLIKAGFVQKDIAEKYADDLKKAQDETAKDAKSNSDQFDTDKSVQAGNAQTKDAYKDLLNLRPYGNYVNPFCDYVQGLYFMGAALDQSDKERAATAFKRAASMEPENPYIKQDIADADSVANGHKLPPVTYVIFETGMAPQMGQIQVPLPLFLANNQAPTVVLYFPTMTVIGDYVPSLGVSAGGANYQTALVSDMDSVILQEFKNALPTITTRMIIAASTKAAIDFGIRQGLKSQNGLVQVGYDVLSAGYQMAANQADLRAWLVLPKQFQVARFPTPADHQLVLTPGDYSGQVSVALTDGPVNVVYVKSVRRGVRMVVRQFVISPDDAKPKAAAPVAAAN
jgi:hypothetical protein